MKKFVFLLLSVLLLSACGGNFEAGDVIVLQEKIHVGETVEELIQAHEDSEKSGVFKTGGAIITVFEGDTVQVIGEDEPTDMMLVLIKGGLNDGTEWWVPKKELEWASGK